MLYNVPPVAAGRLRRRKINISPLRSKRRQKHIHHFKTRRLAAHGLLLAVVRRDLGAKSSCPGDLTFYLVRVGHTEEDVLVI